MPRPTRFSPEVRSRAVRMVVEHEAAHESQWAAITSIAEKISAVKVSPWKTFNDRWPSAERGS